MVLGGKNMALGDGSRRFRERYNPILDDMFQRYGFERLPAGTLMRAREEYEERQRQRQRRAEASQVQKRTYEDALAFWQENKDALREQGVYRHAENIRNDPMLQNQIKAQGFKVNDYIDAMYAAVSDGQWRSEREYNQYVKNLGKGAKDRAAESNRRFQEEQAKKQERREQGFKPLRDRWAVGTKHYGDLSVAPITKPKRNILREIGDIITGKSSKPVTPWDRFAEPPTPSKKERSFFSDVFGGLKSAYQALNPFDDVTFSQAIRQEVEKPRSGTTLELQRAGARTLDSLTLGALRGIDVRKGEEERFFDNRSGSGGVADFIYDMAGFAVPGGLALKGAKMLGAGAKITPNMTRTQRALQRGKEGAVAGALFEGGLAAVNETLNPDRFDAWEYALGIGLGAVGDPLIGGLLDSKPVKNAIKRLTNRVKKGEIPIQQAQDEVEKIVIGLTSGSSKRLEQGKPLGLPEPITRRVPTRDIPEQPKASDEILSLPEPKTTITRRINDPKEFLDFRRQIDEGIKETEDLLKQMEDDFVFQEYGKMYGSKEQEWQMHKRQAEELQKMRKDLEGFKFRIPLSEWSDYADRVPQMFRLPKNSKSSYTIDVAAADAGFEGNIDGFIDFLNNYYNSYRIVKDGKNNFFGYEATTGLKDYENIEKELGKVFRESDEAKSVQQVLDDLRAEREGTIFESDDPLQLRAERFIPMKEEPISYVGKQDRPMSTRVKGQMNIEVLPSGRVKTRTPSTTPEAEYTRKKIKTTRPDVEDFSTKGTMKATTSTVSGNRTNIGEGLADYSPTPKEKDSNATKFNNLSRDWLDDTVYIKIAENELKGAPRFGYSREMHNAILNAKGATAKVDDLIETRLKPIFNRFEEVSNFDVSEALNYRLAKHLKEIKKSNPEYNLPSGYTLEQINDVIKQFESSSVASSFREFDEAMSKYYDELMDFLVESDVLSRKAANSMRKQYKHYIPKYRKDADFEDIEKAFFLDFHPMGGKPIKGLGEGSEKPIKNPIESIVMQTQQIIKAGMENKALRELDVLADLDRSGKWVSRNKKGHAQHEHKIRVNGEEKTVYIDKHLKEALTHMSDYEQNITVRFVRALARTQRLTVTGRPAMALRLFARDALQGLANTRAGLTPMDIAYSIVDVISYNMGKPLKNSRMKEFIESGGGMSSVWAQDRHRYQALQKQAKNLQGFPTLSAKRGFERLIDGYRRNFLEATENAVKLAEFRAARRKGIDSETAASMGRDMYDFLKAGRNVRKVNPYVSFLNSFLQGKSKFVRSFVEPIAEGEYGKALGTLVRHAAVSSVPSLLAFAAYNMLSDGDMRKKKIDEAPQYLRDTYWLFPDPNDPNRIWRVPKPFETAAIFSSPLEYVLRELSGQEQDWNKSLIDWVGNNFLFSGSLNPATPLYEWVTGVDTFYKTPIVPNRLQKERPVDQRDVYTSGIVDKIAEMVDKTPLRDTKAASPKHLQHLIEGYAPYVGRDVLQGLDRLFGIDKEVPEGSKTSAFSEIWEQFMDDGISHSPITNELFDARNRYLGKKQDELSQEEYSKKKEIDKAYKAFSDLSAEITRIRNDENLSSEEKQRKIDPLVHERNELVRNLKNRGILD